MDPTPPAEHCENLCKQKTITQLGTTKKTLLQLHILELGQLCSAYYASLIPEYSSNYPLNFLIILNYSWITQTVWSIRLYLWLTESVLIGMNAALPQIFYLHLQQSLQHLGFKRQSSVSKLPRHQASKRLTLPQCSLLDLSSNFGPIIPALVSNSPYYVLFPNLFQKNPSRPNIYCIHDNHCVALLIKA